jgi:hypothetical protein
VRKEFRYSFTASHRRTAIQFLGTCYPVARQRNGSNFLPLQNGWVTADEVVTKGWLAPADDPMSSSMRLPNARDATVDPDKIARYLLSGTHATGRGKAQFFMRFGFSPEAPDVLRQALRQHAEANDVVSLQESEHGTKYTVEGPLPAPDGRAPVIRSVWIIDRGWAETAVRDRLPGPEEDE